MHVYPSFSNQQSSELVYERLLTLVKSDGLENAETIQVYTKWCELMEQQVEAISDVPESRRLQIEFLISQVRVYSDGGDADEAANILGQAYNVAQAEGLTDLVKKIESFT